MVDAGIGRLLVASLHQGIADVAPARLPFYENWLKPPGMRDARFGLAPLHAVLSFLRREGQQPYDDVMRQAGRYTALWGYENLPAFERALVQRLPARLRARAALHLSRRLVRDTFRGSHATVRLRRGTGTVVIRASIFCAVRETSAAPMCAFYAAAVVAFLERFDIAARADVTRCKASGDDGCAMCVTIDDRRAAATEAAAA